jgi:hypothetical protein
MSVAYQKLYKLSSARQCEDLQSTSRKPRLQVEHTWRWTLSSASAPVSFLSAYHTENTVCLDYENERWRAIINLRKACYFCPI